MFKKILLASIVTFFLATPSAFADLTLEAGVLDFGVVSEGDTVNGSIELTNTGTEQEQNITYSENSPDFEVLRGCTILSAGGSCTLTIEFAPTRKGAFVRQLTIESDTSQTRLRMEGYSDPF